MLYWFYKRRIRSPVNKEDLVLEIGSGDKPHWRSDVLVDMYLYDNSQRNLGNIYVDKNKTFIIANIEYLPFKNKCFDYIIASHILEHVENLNIAIEEITRVGKAGYIEVPYGFLDIIRPFDAHLWICDIKDDRLIFRRKTKYIDPLMLKFGDIFYDIYSDNIIRNLEKFFIMHEWKRYISYDIIDIDTKDKYFYIPKMKYRVKKLSGDKIIMLLMIYLYKFECAIFYRNKKYVRR